MNTYLYTPKPTLVLKKLGTGVKIRAELEERQLIQSTENARVMYDPDHGIVVETDNIEKKLPLMHEGEELLLDTWVMGISTLHNLSCQPEVPEATGATESHV